MFDKLGHAEARRTRQAVLESPYDYAHIGPASDALVHGPGNLLPPCSAFYYFFK